MNCPEYLDISAHVDGMLDPAERLRLDTHLRDCPHCRRRLEQLQLLRRDLRALPMPTPGVDMATLIGQRIGADRRSRRRAERRFWISWGAPGLGVAASLAIGIWLGALLGVGALGAAPGLTMHVFDPVPPGGLCAATELCRASKGLQ
jgi:anti-sigma factor RsiW